MCKISRGGGYSGVWDLIGKEEGPSPSGGTFEIWKKKKMKRGFHSLWRSFYIFGDHYIKKCHKPFIHYSNSTKLAVIYIVATGHTLAKKKELKWTLTVTNGIKEFIETHRLCAIRYIIVLPKFRYSNENCWMIWCAMVFT